MLLTIAKKNTNSQNLMWQITTPHHTTPIRGEATPVMSTPTGTPPIVASIVTFQVKSGKKVPLPGVTFLFNGCPLVMLPERNNKCSMCKQKLIKWRCNRVICCGQFICNDCNEKQKQDVAFFMDPINLIKGQRCVVCRSKPLTNQQDAFQRLMVFANKYNCSYSQVKIGDYHNYNLNDYKSALEWYNRASIQGNPQAHFKLGVLYENGFGCRRSLKRAHKYFVMALNAGVQEARVHKQKVKALSKKRLNHETMLRSVVVSP
jgi:hypothetical protein